VPKLPWRLASPHPVFDLSEPGGIPAGHHGLDGEPDAAHPPTPLILNARAWFTGQPLLRLLWMEY
jgi:hypothetical protein